MREDKYTDGLRVLGMYSEESLGATRQKLRLEPTLIIREVYYHTVFLLNLRIGEEKMYVFRNIKEFLSRAEQGSGEMEFGKGLTVRFDSMFFGDEISEGLWELLNKAWQEENAVSFYTDLGSRYYSSGGSVFYQKDFYLTPRMFLDFLRLMSGRSVPCSLHGDSPVDTQVVQENVQPRISVERWKEDGRISLCEKECFVLDEAARVIYKDGILYLQEEAHAKDMSILTHLFRNGNQVFFKDSDMARVFEGVLPRLKLVADVQVADDYQNRFLTMPLRAELYLDYCKDGIEVRPVFFYGEHSFHPVLREEPEAPKGCTILRDRNGENDLMNYFYEYGFHEQGSCMVQEDEEKSYEFLMEALPALAEKAEVFYAEGFAEKPVRMAPKITAGVSINDENLLEVTFRAKDVDMDEILDILSSYRQKRKYHRMKDGSFITLGERQLSSMAQLAESTGMKKGMTEEQKVQLPLSHAMYLDQMAREDESLRLERSKQFRALVRDIRHPEDVDVDVPESLQDTLRDYQVTGFGWLSALSSYHLGGILADDMGLGKTLQVLSFLVANQDGGKPPSLVVAPTSLLYNWLDEMARFTPTLKGIAVTGSKEERKRLLEESGGSCDVLVTTYNLLKRDAEIYEKMKFRYCFLDEAQQIKNPTTQNAKAVKKLQAEGCFALTGTPMENTLTELWSIFDFLMPGYLGSHKKFKERYEIPIVRAGEEQAARDLRRKIMPFILRRLKKDVLQELPDKVESRRMNVMTAKQAKLYRAYFLKSQKEFAAVLQGGNAGEVKIKILSILTRLRQIACDPSLFLEDYDGGAGKLDMLEEIVGEAMESGHRMLVFSQFTTMLQNIGKRLSLLGIPYFYLDGGTPSLKRMELVREFNKGAVPVFLISLKAGGTGLNLTGADMVIHYDPWWNPAVEDQATDRAYRLGQQKNVQVLKLITKDTIEEKIYQLQEKKKNLIDRMIQPGETFLSKLTDEEIQELFRG